MEEKDKSLISSLTLVNENTSVSLETIQSKIYEIRGVKVMLDFDLAKLYGVENFNLKKAVRRNIERFPDDFMFELTKDEAKILLSRVVFQNGIPQYNFSAYTPFAFTEEGVAMLSSVLRSKISVQINIAIMRAFVAVRKMLYISTNVTKEIESLRDRVSAIEKGYDDTLQAVNDLSEDMRSELDEIYLALGELAKKSKQVDEQNKQRKPIGFKRQEE